MKRQEQIPEKIYVSTHSGIHHYEQKNDDDIEYTRTDAFIEKAVEHIDGLIEFLNEFGHQLKKERIIEDFKKYMKGE